MLFGAVLVMFWMCFGGVLDVFMEVLRRVSAGVAICSSRCFGGVWEMFWWCFRGVLDVFVM